MSVQQQTPHTLSERRIGDLVMYWTPLGEEVVS